MYIRVCGVQKNSVLNTPGSKPKNAFLAMSAPTAAPASLVLSLGVDKNAILAMAAMRQA